MPDPLDPDTVRNACTRSIAGHGPRSPHAEATKILDSIGADETVDFYGGGKLIEDFEAHVAELLGKPAAVFMPSGTMAQQIALRVWCDEAKRPAVAYHSSSHLHMHERNAIVELHRLDVTLLGEPERPLSAADVAAVETDLGAVLIELPQRELGGVLPEWGALEELVAAVRSKGAAVHLDGARLWEATPFYDRTPSAIAALFDSVYVSFYKGLGGVAGAVLAGSPELVAASKTWQRRHGGNLISLWPYVVSARRCLAERLDRMPAYVAQMRAFADALREIDGVRITPDPPHVNMAHIVFPGEPEALSLAALEVSQRSGVWVGHGFNESARLELYTGDASLEVEPGEVAQLLGEVVRRAADHAR